MKDLILLVADKNMQYALKGGLERSKGLNIRSITFDFLIHPQHDPGVRTTGVEMLRHVHSQYNHALLILDFEGSGSKTSDALELEGELDQSLEPLWHARAKAIVIAPELDIWMWGSDNAIEPLSGKPDGKGIRLWLKDQKFQFNEDNKPLRPKEALESLLKKQRIPRSSSLYSRIASKISFDRCTDPAFARLKKQLQAWFPIECDSCHPGCCR
jgi:hypothetical protein